MLNSENFNVDTDLTLIVKKKPLEKEKFSTAFTILDLDYGRTEIAERLKELTYKNYSETLFDDADRNPPLLFVFGKLINGDTIYIKLKVRDGKKKHIICLSFHYAEHTMYYPYH